VIVIIYFGITNFQSALASYLRSMVIHRNGPWVSGVYWSLAVETFFYGMIFILLFLNVFRYLERCAVALGVLSLAYLVGVAFFDLPIIRKIFLLQHGCFFSIGIIIWLCSEDGISKWRLSFIALMIVAALLEIATFHAPTDLKGTMISMVLWIVSLVAIVASIVFEWRGTAFTRILGLITYPLYLIHEIFGSIMLRVNFWTGKYLALIIAIAVSIIISWSVVNLDRPIRRMIERAIDGATTFFPDQMLIFFKRKTEPAVV
jgi:peptidoglycan/LPS O-acetylase OafA/YrhL